jgi:hypothetical protein
VSVHDTKWTSVTSPTVVRVGTRRLSILLPRRRGQIRSPKRSDFTVASRKRQDKLHGSPILLFSGYAIEAAGEYENLQVDYAWSYTSAPSIRFHGFVI